MTPRGLAAWLYAALASTPFVFLGWAACRVAVEPDGASAFGFGNFWAILADPAWRAAYAASLGQAIIGAALAVLAALPAAYAFARHRFVADRALFAWFLANRLTPPVLLAAPIAELARTLGLLDVHLALALVHGLVMLPIAIWILQGAIAAVPRAVDEAAFLDGYSFLGFLGGVLLPSIERGLIAAAFFCFAFAWVEVLLAQAATTDASAPLGVMIAERAARDGADWGPLAAASFLAIIPGVAALALARASLADGLALGRRRSE